MYYSIQKNTATGYKVFHKENIQEVVSFFKNIEPLNQKEVEMLENGMEVDKYVFGETYIVEKVLSEIPEERVFDDSYCGIDLEEFSDCF